MRLQDSKLYFVTFDFVTLRRFIRCGNSRSKILLLYNNIIITHNNSHLHFPKVLIVTNSHVTKAHFIRRFVLKRLTRTTGMVDSFPKNYCGLWSEECGVRYASRTSDFVYETKSQCYSHSTLLIPHSS